MAETSTAKFTVGETEHSLTVTEVGADYVKVRLESDPIELELKVGESKKADLNADGANDVEILLNGIFGKKADITIKEVTEEAAEEKPEETETPTTPEEAGNYTWVWVLVIVIVVIAVIVYFATKKKK